jgi:hypothetical protein
MNEYLYVDTRRLDSYYEQISLPVEYDKVPVWKFGLSFSGPKVEGQQTRSARPPTEHEKIQKFLKSITDNRQISSECNFKASNDFVTESLLTRQAIISTKERTLIIWISIASEQKNLKRKSSQYSLFLIEDYQGGDKNVRRLSGYSSLYLLLGELTWLNSDLKDQPLIKLREQDEATKQFALDPISTLRSIGARIGPEQEIKATYRVRASCVEMEGESGNSMAIIGYPIIIQR